VRGGRQSLGSRVTYLVLHTLAKALARVYFRTYARNKEHMPDGAVIISPNHRSNLDVPLLGATSPRRLRYLAKGSLFKTRFWGWFLTTLGGFPLDRGSSADRGALKAALSVLERGEALAVFPEGERKAGPTVHPMADGAVWLSVKSGAPILPVGIGGSERAMPKGANVPKPTRLVFLYGEPIPAPTNPDGSRVSRKQMREASDQLRITLQDLFDRAQELAGTPNPPEAERPPLPVEI
ncbi:MAG: lysophospholipid acyltransferase family protein, partial [Actinomycetota bacterium]